MERWVAITVAIVGLNIAGCAPKPSLLGTWQSNEADGSTQLITVTADQLTIDFKEASKDVKIVSSYKSTDKTIIYTFQEMTIGSEKMNSVKGKSKEMTYVFTNNDTLQVTPLNGSPVTWKRVK